MNIKVDYICTMKTTKLHTIISILILAAIASWGLAAQAATPVSPESALKLIELKPRNEAKTSLLQLLNSTATTGSKPYKAVVTAMEEMLSEPTWDFHNEELFALLVEHAATASCLSDNDKVRYKALLEVTRKNAPGSMACDIAYETLDGSRHKMSDITSTYTLIYFNDPECLSCAKVKERLDTCSTLKNMVQAGRLTVVGIYPYDNVDEWKMEPMPEYIVNGWDHEQQVDGNATYDLMTMPLFYLLDREKRVILKNEASLNRILKVMSQLNGLDNSDIESKLNATFNR